VIALLQSLEAPWYSRSWGITVLRVIVGFAFAMHGWQKVAELGIPTVQQGFEQIGVPQPALAAPLVAYLELIGGAALIVGLFTRWLALALAIDMLAAMVLVHASGGFFAPDGIELPLALFAGCAALAFGGPGAVALDALLTRPSGNPAWRVEEPLDDRTRVRRGRAA